jgi:hypothetical protein
LTNVFQDLISTGGAQTCREMTKAAEISRKLGQPNALQKKKKFSREKLHQVRQSTHTITETV